MTETKQEFKPNAVLFPDGDGEPILLMHLGDNQRGNAYTKEEWEQDAISEISLVDGAWFDSDSICRVEWLPEICIIKINERRHWIDETILKQTTRIFGVYAFNRRLHVHICSFSASYEMHFLGTQYEAIDDLTEKESESLFDAIREGDAQTESICYMDRYEVDSIMENTFQEGWLPEKGNGGCVLSGVVSVTHDEALEEVREAYCQQEF